MIEQLLSMLNEEQLKLFMSKNFIVPTALDNERIAPWLESYMSIISEKKSLTSLEAFGKEVKLSQAEVSNLINGKGRGISEGRRTSLIQRVRELIASLR